MIEIFELIDGLKYLANNDINPEEITDRATGAFNPRKGSIMARARASTCQYPLLVSSNVSLEDYSKVRGILEQLYANNLRMTITNAAQVIDLKKGDNISKVINQVHQNDYANYGFSGSEVVNKINNVLSENYSLFFNVNDKNGIINSNRSLLTPYLDNFNKLNLNTLQEASSRGTKKNFDSSTNYPQNDFSFSNMDNYYVGIYASKIQKYKTFIDDGNDPRSKEGMELQADITKFCRFITDEIQNHNLQLSPEESAKFDQYKPLAHALANGSYYNEVISRNKDKKDPEMENLKKQKEMLTITNQNLQNRKLLDEIDKLEKEVSSSNVKRINTDMLIRKNNEIEPSIMEIDFVYDSGMGMKEVRVSIGVKCVTHLIPYNEFVRYIPETLVKKKAMFRMIQWTTGEIKLLKDLIFDFDNQKHQAVTKDDSVKWWRHLHSRSNGARIRNAVGKKDSPIIPNASILLSIADMELMKISKHLDLMGKDKFLMNKLMDYYFLLNFIVVDVADNVLYMWNDAYKEWERYTFKQLDKETKEAIERNNRISLR